MLHPYIHSFPTRRSSDLIGGLTAGASLLKAGHDVTIFEQAAELSEIGACLQLSANATHVLHQDRKSTRLNSSHQIISYAVFCLKKKTRKKRASYRVRSSS